MLIKSKADQKQLNKGGRIMGKILAELVAMVKPGVSAYQIDQHAEELIRKAGGRPAFKGYQTTGTPYPFPSTICFSLGSEIVHGIPRHQAVIKNKDLVSIDIGMEWPFEVNNKQLIVNSRRVGLFTDTAVTIAVGKVAPEVKRLVEVTRVALEEGIKAAKPGNSVAAIGRAVENYVKKQGKYGIIRDLVGHGVGHQVHEDPHIPNYYDPGLESIILKPGMVIAIEPMISLGGHKVRQDKDGWTISMSDGSLCAHFEHTVIIGSKKSTVVTRRPNE